MNYIFYIFMAAYAVFGAIVWRLRGGAWSTYANVHIGTNLTRLVTGFLLAAPLMGLGFNPWLLGSLIIAIPLGLILAGWGPYMNMTVDGDVTQTSWIDTFPRLLGFAPNTVAWCWTGMTVCGLIVYSLVAFAIFLATVVGHWSLMAMLPALIGVLVFPLTYWGFSRLVGSLPVITGFAATHDEWSECTVGATMAIVILATCRIAGIILF